MPIVFFLLLMSRGSAMAQDFQLLEFPTEDAGKVEAALFKASDTQAVIFAHGAIFDKESWYFLAENFQHEGISALALDFRGYGNSVAGSSTQKKYDVLAAITYLNEHGFTDISIVGGSMGGAAVLAALPGNEIPVRKVILLAPAGGPAVASATTEKLFIVSEDEQMFSAVVKIYTSSAEPKQLKIYPGSTHAQHLFKTDNRDDLVARIVEFIASPTAP